VRSPSKKVSFKSSLVLLIGALTVFSPLSAQVPSRPVYIGSGAVENLDKLTADLSELYFTGQWDALQRKIDGLALWIERPGDGKTIREILDPKADFYLVVFLAREEGGDLRLVRFAWHKPAPAPYAASIPGEREIREIVLGAGVDFDLRTGYLSTQIEDPFLAEAPRFVKKIESFMIRVLVGDREGGKVPTAKEVPANFIVRKVGLPYARAKVQIADAATLREQAAARAGIKEIRVSFTFANAPWPRWSFGLVSAILLDRGYAADRVRLTDDGYYADDPPENPLTAAILNFHPAAFDPDRARMSLAERFRLFAGVVLEPDMGICAGAGFGLLRGLSVNAGLALMGLQTPRDPRDIVVNGRAKTLPGDPDAPFRTAWMTVAFAGFGYSF
jgi:hypothetical protein